MASPGATTFATHTNSPLELIDASHVNNVQTAINNIETGWLASEDTWVYVSASSFKIIGVNRTTVYQKGTLLWFLNSGTKYAVVASSSFSTDTTVNIFVNTDYVIANAAITAPYYSYAANPQGAPTWYNFTGVTGLAASPTYNIARYSVVGQSVFMQVMWSGTSNNTAKTLVLPVACVTLTNLTLLMPGITTDNAGARATGNCSIVSAATSANFYKDLATTAYTATGATTGYYPDIVYPF